ncbi:MAG TPA: exodeoxyribonuclease VII large subunit [Thermoanaerobaculia bacterium]|nr:exodeoxyribonuclease VII large subunit [Thermoanaerobaculia bacterium]
MSSSRFRPYTVRRAPARLKEAELSFGAGGPEASALTVSEFVARLDETIRGRFPDAWVKGELSEWSIRGAGHAYFSLKDEHAKLECVMWASVWKRLAFRPEVGTEFLAHGYPNVYAPYGKLSFVVSELQPYGAGALQIAFEQLRARLAGEGLFDLSKKRKLPLLPRRIGVVTSQHGAALHDILRVLSVRFPNAHVTIYPARAQGEGAPAEIAAAVSAFSRVPGSADVLIVARGGGSKEDLAAYNDERVVRAVAASAVPTISAVGHEVDVTLTDLAADVRAATPSQAAELVVARREDFESRLAATAGDLRKILRGKLAEADSALKGLRLEPGFVAFPSRVSAAEADADATAAALVATFQALPLAFSERLARSEEKLRGWPSRAAFPLLLRSAGQLADALAERMKGVLNRASGRLTALSASLEALSPLKVLSRGYSVTYREEERTPLRDAATVSAGDALRILLEHGELRARVTEAKVPDDEG